MYLKRLELKGFKSFPNKTDILFKEGITAIVGPNGSGKSNISDAVRWVLGEQSVKSLRGDKLEDVIFAGSDNKKAMNYCEVSLTIDNEDDKLELGFSEVTIKRRAYRNGESQFYLNNKVCRLKDIKEILLDTGIGKDGYSIIEQGKVDEILSSNPINRRKVFDEACGIAKFRYKKNEAEKNLKNTKENLERIDDIYIEIENQLNPLYEQQQKAIKYKELKEDLKVKEINNYIKEIDNINNQIKEIESEREVVSKEIGEQDLKKQLLEVKLQESNKDVNKLEEDISKLSEYINTIKSVINNKDSQIEIINEKKNSCRENVNRINIQITENEKNISENSQKINILSEDIKTYCNNIKIDKDKLNEFEETNKNKKQKINSLNTQIEDLKDGIISILDNKQEVSNKLSTLKANEINILDREEIIDRELNNLNQIISEKDQSLAKTLVTYNNLTNKEELYEKTNKSIENKIISINENISKSDKLIQSKHFLLKEYNSKLNVYKEMESHHEGFNKGVKEVLKNKNLNGIYGALGQVITVSQKYEKAIEASLGAYMQNIITEDENSAKEAINYLKKNNLGRVTFLPSNVIKSNKINTREIKSSIKFINIASDLVSYDEKYKNIIENVLGRTIVIDNIDNGIKLAKQTNHRYKIVTLDGEILNPGGSLTGGSLRTNGNILSRKRIINEYEENIVKENNLINNLVNNQKELKKEYDTNVEELNKNKILIQTNNNEINKQKNIISMIKYDIASLKDSLSKLENEKNSLYSNLNYLKNKIGELTNQTNDINQSHIKTKEEIDKLSKILDVINNEYESEKEKYDSLNLELVKLIENNQSLEKELLRLTNDNKILDNKVGLDKESLVRHNKEFEDFNTQISVEKTEKINLENQLTDNNKKMDNKLVSKKALKDNLESVLRESKSIDREYMVLKENEFKINSKIERFKINNESHIQNLFESYQLTFVEAIKYKDEDIVINKKDIEILKRDIKKLGNVNLDSIVEYEQVKERYDFYSEQKKDLEDSVTTIEDLINELEENMKIEFSIKFNEINENFKYVYKRLFGGGYGELKILDKENILESDIEITAQPPGKKTKNLNLLSGGEKALTAISILFSIILAKPTPFCILDEIEAPLDDANIFRFGEFLRELSIDTQFISVTHRRGTMEAANYIYGVTMQEKATSKVISLKLDEAKEITDAI